MAITGKSPKVETRLSSDGYEKFRQLAKVANVSQADLARKAILWYMENHERLVNEERDSQLTQALNGMTNRICGMLARQGTEIGTVFELMWQDMPEEKFLAALNKTKDRLRERLTKDEQALAAKHKKVIEA